MTRHSNAPAFIIWVFALLAILTPPQIVATGFATLLEAQEAMLDVLVDEPVDVAIVAGDVRRG
jgi:hypothetical protein